MIRSSFDDLLLANHRSHGMMPDVYFTCYLAQQWGRKGFLTRPLTGDAGSPFQAEPTQYTVTHTVKPSNKLVGEGWSVLSIMLWGVICVPHSSLHAHSLNFAELLRISCHSARCPPRLP